MTANRIIDHIFNQPDLRDVDQASLERLVESYPYFAAARVLLAQKQFSSIPDYNTPVFKKAQLYASSPHYLYQLALEAEKPAVKAGEGYSANAFAPAVNGQEAVPDENDIVAKLEAEAEASLTAGDAPDPDALMETIIAEETPPVAPGPLNAEEEIALEDEVSAEDQAILDALEAEDLAAAAAKAEAEARKAAEEAEAKRIAQEEAAAKAAEEAEAKRIAEEEAAAKAAAEAEAKRIAEEQAAAKAAAEAEAKRIAEEEAAAKAAAEAEAKRIAEEEAAAEAAAEAEAKRVAEEEAAAKAAAEAEAKRIAEEEAAAKAAAEAEAKRIAEEEATKAAAEAEKDEIVAVDYEAVEAEIARTSTEDEIVAIDYEAAEAEAARTSTEDEIVAIDYDALKPEEPSQYEPEIEEEEIVVPSETEPEGTGLTLPRADPEIPLEKVATDEDIEEAEEPRTAEEEETPIRIHPMDTPAEETVLTFQPLYTEDYFAYKKLKDPNAADKMNEKAAAEMRSFTDWLRELKDNFSGKAAKDWYHQQLHKLYEDDDPEVTERVEKMAMQSITLNDDIVSETLAEIWVRQHQPEKAIAIYQKLSLLNPGKNAYFAQKIKELQLLTDNNK